MIEIESNIPIPKVSGATKHREMYEAFDKMDVEQSFVESFIHFSGLKCPDSLVAALCYKCHYELDNGKSLSKEERRQMWNEAYIRTMQTLIETERLIISD